MDYGYIKDGKVIRNSFLNFPEREIGEVKESDEEAIKFFQEKFDKLRAEVEEIKGKVESQANKGSFLVKVQNLKNGLTDSDALGDFESLHTILEKLEIELNEYIEQNRHKNLQIKSALLEEAKIIAKSHEWKSATAAIQELQQKWIKTGAVDEEQREKIENEFKELTNEFFERRSGFYQELEQMMVDKERDFEKFIESAKKKLSGSDIEQVKKTQSDLMVEWKSLGKIKPEKHTIFWEDFQKVMKSAYAKAKKAAKSAKSNVEENLKSKKEIISKLEKTNEDLVPKTNVAELKNAWKNAGFAGKELNDELNEKFNHLTSLVSDKLFLDQLLNKKTKKGTSEAERNKLRVRLMYDLLNRDLSELKTFEENVDKFRTAKGLDNLLESKLDQQKRKVKVKKDLLDFVKSYSKSQK